LPYKDIEKQRAWKRAWKERNRDKVLAEKKRYREKKRANSPTKPEKVPLHGHNKRHRPDGKDSPEYSSYIHAKMRCNNPKTDGYKNYGGRGIEFKFTSFLEFYEHIGPRPEGTSLDRKDNNGHYEPGNVKWSTQSNQLFNRRKKSEMPQTPTPLGTILR
jgi:hypothetical protein